MWMAVRYSSKRKSKAPATRAASFLSDSTPGLSSALLRREDPHPLT